MQDLTSANVSDDYTVGGTTVKGGVSRSHVAGQVGTIPTADFHNMQLIEFQNVLEAAGDSLRSDVGGDDGKQLLRAINAIADQYSISIGTVITHAAKSVANLPNRGEWVVCDGRSLLIAEYPELYAIIGDNFGDAAKPPNGFYIPDTVSRFIFPTDTLTGIDGVGGQGGKSAVTLLDSNLPDHSHTGVPSDVPLASGEGGGAAVNYDSLGGVTGGLNGIPTQTDVDILPPYVRMFQFIRIK